MNSWQQKWQGRRTQDRFYVAEIVAYITTQNWKRENVSFDEPHEPHYYM
jgi:hypothetical protein